MGSKKKAIVRLTGRCGNQLFQYCYGRSVALDNHAELWIYGDCNVYASWPNELPGFNVQCQFKKRNPYSLWDKARFTLGSKRLENLKARDRWIAYYRRHGIFYTYYALPPKVEIESQKIFLIPIPDNERHDLIDKNRGVLLKEITAKEPVPYDDIFTSEVKTRETACVSVRRDDFLSDKYKALHFVCGETYFKRAIAKAKELIMDPLFIVFSDDIEWCKQSGLFPKDAIYEKPGNTIPQKLMLMKECKNFIISNSTFSWWAQYLSTSSHKVVIAPSIWKPQGDYSYMYQDYWALVDPKES
jgi:hypothetical protein